MEKLINSGQNVPAVLLAKDILRLVKLGVAEKSINQRDDSGYTPLHYVVSNKDYALVEDLLESGADVNVIIFNDDDTGATALWQAIFISIFLFIRRNYYLCLISYSVIQLFNHYLLWHIILTQRMI